MAIQRIHIEHFLQLAERYPVLDVRSPAEYKQAHIPGAYSLPLFTDEERRIVGTSYKQHNRETAIKIGLEFFGPKMRSMIEEVERILASWERGFVDNELQSKKDSNGSKNSPERSNNCVLVHCWRGGMRSAGVAWLLDLYGFKVYSLLGGYKAYRTYVLNSFHDSYNFKILGGYTGSGKTIVLHELERAGERIIDLEAIACHRGSAFGAIGQAPQPSQEMFENLLSDELRKKAADSSMPVPIWLEDESQRIGLVNIPQPIWQAMRSSPVYFLDIPFDERVLHVVETYGKLDKEKIVNAIVRITKRLGGLETKTAINFLLEDNTPACFSILLKYYDKYYLRGLYNRVNHTALINRINCEKVFPLANAEKILAIEKFPIESNSMSNE